MLDQVCQKSIEVVLQRDAFKRQVRLVLELEHGHLLTLVAHDLGAAVGSEAFIVDSRYLDVDALSLTLLAELTDACVTMHGGELGHESGALEEVVKVDLVVLDAVFNEVLCEHLHAAVEAGAHVDVVATMGVCRLLLG